MSPEATKPPLAPAHLAPRVRWSLIRLGDNCTINAAWSEFFPGVRDLHGKDKDMSGLTRKETADRSKINIDRPREVQFWTRHLNITKEELQKAIDKVGNAAAAVQKELGLD